MSSAQNISKDTSQKTSKKNKSSLEASMNSNTSKVSDKVSDEALYDVTQTKPFVLPSQQPKSSSGRLAYSTTGLSSMTPTKSGFRRLPSTSNASTFGSPSTSGASTFGQTPSNSRLPTAGGMVGYCAPVQPSGSAFGHSKSNSTFSSAQGWSTSLSNVHNSQSTSSNSLTDAEIPFSPPSGQPSFGSPFQSFKNPPKSTIPRQKQTTYAGKKQNGGSNQRHQNNRQPYQRRRDDSVYKYKITLSGEATDSDIMIISNKYLKLLKTCQTGYMDVEKKK